MKVFSPFLNGDTTTSGSLNLPQHPTSASISNPNTGSIYHDTTDNIVKVYTGTQWQVLGEQTTPGAGGGGASGIDIEYLLVAGGGAGGNNIAAGGGAGGSGIVLVRVPGSKTVAVTPGTNGVTSCVGPANDKVAKFTVSGTLTIS